MKLTKAQRLFIKAGIEMCEYAYYKWVDTCDNCEVSCDIVKHRKKYKQIIREALEAWESEQNSEFCKGIGSAIEMYKEQACSVHK